MEQHQVRERVLSLLNSLVKGTWLSSFGLQKRDGSMAPQPKTARNTLWKGATRRRMFE